MSGAIFVFAIWASVKTRKQHRTFSEWWDSAGLGIWLLAGSLGCTLLLR